MVILAEEEEDEEDEGCCTLIVYVCAAGVGLSPRAGEGPGFTF